ncbi:LPS export ABC transporter periplasmic protein LptC [Terasakiispira papahanaumokuakeensis]|uniref:LPS export ABC transporter periplasmic protein LptC n=2 Tax=Terasakiispira papahanaumokuakeensis TaxID=197479 RepID=A0A1E2V6Q8_9GAMM|nr:LPS export ABC transporter periplasmic protein LptC [Terasakiispira papahanaumokuakeensis]
MNFWKKRKFRKGMALTGLVILGLALYEAQETRHTAPELPLPQVAGEPDYYLEGATLKHYTTLGQLQQTVTTPKLAHYPEQDLTTLLTPKVFGQNAAGQQWDARANSGTLRQSDTQLQLNQDIVLTLKAPDNRPPLTLTTTTLSVDLPHAQAQTEDPIQITQGEDITRALGLNVDLQQGILILPNQVEGHYESIRSPNS